MARNRYLPFGYRIRQGEITIYPIEAAYIREIFSAYIDGSSYAQIAQDMQDRGIQYHEGTTAWNKHMVKRILENERYTGKDGYPAIVSSEQYKRAAAVRQSKGAPNLPESPGRKPCLLYQWRSKPE